MTDHELRAIVYSRLEGWIEKLLEAHATPLALVAVGHDQNRGTSFVLTTEDISDEHLGILLSAASRRVRGSVYASEAIKRL